jgi:MFS family permease
MINITVWKHPEGKPFGSNLPMTRYLFKNSPVVVVFSTYIAIEICKVTGWVFGPPMQRYFNLSNTQLGMILSALSLGAMVMSFGMGTLINRIGLWRIWKIGIIGSMVSLLLFFFAVGFWTVFIPLFALGLMHALTINANNTYLSGAFRNDSLRVMGLASGLWFGSSAVSTPLIGMWVDFAENAGMGKSMFVIPYVLEVLMLAAVLILGCKYAQPHIRKTESDDRETLNGNNNKLITKQNFSRWLAIIIISYCHGILIVGMISWTNPMVQDRFNVSDLYGSLTFAGFALGLAAGRIAVAVGLIKLETKLIMAIGGLGGGIILALTMFAGNLWLTIIGLIIGGTGVSVAVPCFLAMISEEFPTLRAHVYGHIGVAICVAAFIAPSLIGFLADNGMALNAAILISPFSAIILGITSLVWYLRSKRAGEASACEATG